MVFITAGLVMKCMRNLNSSDLRPEVNTKNGVMLGRYRKTQSGAKFSSFTKIPYARPPVGNLRFALPEPAPPWQGVLDASKPCPKPVQNNYVTGITKHTISYEKSWAQNLPNPVLQIFPSSVLLLHSNIQRSICVQ